MSEKIKPKLTAGELFAGYGGLALAVEYALNATTAWVCEFEEAPSKILAQHFPDAPNFRDVTTVDWGAVPPVDIISGGSPCQDVSLAGARQGMTEGTRSNLWVSMREAIKTIRPRLVVWENVKGARSATASSDLEPCPGCMGTGGGDNAEPALRALGRILGDLASLGYSAQWRSIRASDIGAPHHRERVFVLAWRDDSYTYSDRRGEGRQEPIQSHEISSATARLGECHRRRGAPDTGSDTARLFPTPTCSDTRGAPLPKTYARRLAARGRTISGNLAEDINYILPPLGNLDRRSGGETQSVFREYAPTIEQWEAITGNKAPLPTCPSRTGKPQLNPEFSEWMMGLPAGWVTSPVLALTRAQQLKAIGNGVVPQQAASALAEMMMNLEEIRGRK